MIHNCGLIGGVTYIRTPNIFWIHLNSRPAVGVDGVEILMYSVQQPQQKLLGIMLSVSFKLCGIF